MAAKGDNPQPNDDNFVAKIVTDPSNPPDTLLLRGYLGASSEEEHTRLYFDPELHNYVEIPDDAILHTQAIPQEQAPLGESYVWVREEAELTYGRAGESRTKASFLDGPILREMMGLAPQQPMAGVGQRKDAGEGEAQPGPRPITHDLTCWPTRVPRLCGPGGAQQAYGFTMYNPSCATRYCPAGQEQGVGPQMEPQGYIPMSRFGGPWCGTLYCPRVQEQGTPQQAYPISQYTICQSWACPSQLVICQSLACPSRFQCPSRYDACPSAPGQCESQFCPSQAVACQSLVCPSRVGCPSLACGPGGGGWGGGWQQGGGQQFGAQQGGWESQYCSADCPSLSGPNCPTWGACPSVWAPCPSSDCTSYWQCYSLYYRCPPIAM